MIGGWRARAVTTLAALLALSVSLPAAAQVEVRIDSILLPYGKALALEAWAEFRLDGRLDGLARSFPIESGDLLIKRFSVTGGERPVAGELERVWFPATVYVGRSCPPQDLAELDEVEPRRGGVRRRRQPATKAERRGAWIGFSAAGADRLIARYQCFPHGHEIGPEDAPPDSATPPA